MDIVMAIPLEIKHPKHFNKNANVTIITCVFKKIDFD